MTNNATGVLGAALLVVGLFVPIATLPFLGSVTLMSGGFGSNFIAIGLLILALLSGLLLWTDRRDALIWTGGAALLTIIFVFGRMQLKLMHAQSVLAEKAEGNPFAGLAQTVMATASLQWGWLILAAGPAVLIYVAIQERKDQGLTLFSASDDVERIAAGIAVLALLIAPVQYTWGYFNSSAEITRGAGSAPWLRALKSETTPGPSAEEASYISDSLRLYEFEARYYASFMKGRVPGVNFKIKNEGSRTINNLTVKVVFYDADDKPISEEIYIPVNVDGFNVGTQDRPLRPNYIWQQETGSFYTAENVPSEWQEGNARATITAIKFDPAG